MIQVASLFIILVVTFAQNLKAEYLSLEDLRQRAIFELQFNPGLSDPSFSQVSLIDIPHLEIPKRLFKVESNTKRDHNLQSALEFRGSDGEIWIRWIPSHGDTHFLPMLQELLRSHGIDDQVKNRFVGFRTSSRSLFVYDPQTKVSFSSKAPTNLSSGIWNSKPWTYQSAKRALLASEYFSHLGSLYPELFNDFGYQKDNWLFNIPGIDQTMTIRELQVRPEGTFLVPLSDFLHETFGRTLDTGLKTNGQAKLPFENHVDVLLMWGYRYGQFLAISGLAGNSNHGQNSLIELDEENRPTGYVEFRDFGDARLAEAVPRVQGFQKIVDHWQSLQLVTDFSSSTGKAQPYAMEDDYLIVNVAPFHGNRFPKWYSEGKLENALYSVNHRVNKHIVQIADGPASAMNPELMYRPTFVASLARSEMKFAAEDMLGISSVGMNSFSGETRPMDEIDPTVHDSTFFTRLDFPEQDLLKRRYG